MARGISPLPIIKLFERDASPSARENLGYSFSLTGDRPNEPAGLQVSHLAIKATVWFLKDMLGHQDCPLSVLTIERLYR